MPIPSSLSLTHELPNLFLVRYSQSSPPSPLFGQTTSKYQSYSTQTTPLRPLLSKPPPMASACVNNSLPMSPPHPSPSDPPSDLPPPDFEFCLDHPVAMLPADQLFSDGKLLPLHFSSANPLPCSPPSECPRQNLGVMANLVDAHLFSPKAPRCSSRWRELLRLKKLHSHAASTAKAVASPSNATSSAGGSRSLKHFLHRSSKSAGSASASSSDSSSLLNLPLLKHSDSLDFSIPTSSRLSLSSSSQAHDHEDLPRLSLDSDKTRPPRMRSLRPRSDSLLPYLDNNGNSVINGRGCSITRPVAASNRAGRSSIRKAGAVTGTGTQPDAAAAAAANRGVSVDSPRMNSSGRVVFQSLERSSSSPSSFNGGGQRLKHRGVERSYSAGVRIAPVLNVPICTLRGSSGVSKSGSGVFGLGQLFISSPQKKENGNGSGNVGRGQRSNNGKSSKG